MRRFLVKHFVLDYFITIFGQRYSFPRASRVITPIFILTGYLRMEEHPVSWYMVGLTVLVLYFGFIHFKIWPAKYDELDASQKKQYNIFKNKTN